MSDARMEIELSAIAESIYVAKQKNIAIENVIWSAMYLLKANPEMTVAEVMLLEAHQWGK
jgi:hypothetical protein